MIITLIIYVLIIGYIILKAFYTSISIKPFNNNQKIKKFSDSINLISMPFYIKMSQIHLLCIFINLNHHNFEIKDYSKVSQGFLRDIDNILNRQNNWIQEIFSSQKTLTAIEFNDVTGRITTTSKLISNAFDNFIVSNNNNTPQINIDNLTFKVNYVFFTLEKVSPILSDRDSFNRNWDGNQIIIYPEEIQQFRGYNELRDYAPFRDYSDSNYIKKNIDNFHKKFLWKFGQLGFKTRDGSITYDPNLITYKNNYYDEDNDFGDWY